MLAEVVSGSISILETVSPIRRLLHKTDLHVREIESIDIKAQTVTTTPGFSHQPNVIHYDHIVEASIGSLMFIDGCNDWSRVRIASARHHGSIGNPDLNSEQADGIDVSLRHMNDRLRSAATCT
jgi:hypothetical protein